MICLKLTIIKKCGKVVINLLRFITKKLLKRWPGLLVTISELFVSHFSMRPYEMRRAKILRK